MCKYFQVMIEAANQLLNRSDTLLKFIRRNIFAQRHFQPQCKQDCSCISALCSPPPQFQICESSSWLQREKTIPNLHITSHLAFSATDQSTRKQKVCFHTLIDKEFGHIEGGLDCRRGMGNRRPCPFKSIFLWMPLCPVNRIVIC